MTILHKVQFNAPPTQYTID